MAEHLEHSSVLLPEVVELLALESGADAADLTLGAGGHAEAMLNRTGPEGRLLGIDRDPEALVLARQRLQAFGDRLFSVEGRAGEFEAHAASCGFSVFDGILADLGVSSMQLDRAERGFSFMRDGPLDMRMTSGKGETAAQLIERADAVELEDIFRRYGEEPRAGAVARKIVELRRRTRIKTTKELAELVRSVVRGGGKTHPATRVFQALRIAVNDELGEVERIIAGGLERLRPGGRLAIISFHSLEDRIVKQAFRAAEREGRGTQISKRPISPSEAEQRKNPRARSAKLRGFRRAEQESGA